MVICWLTKGKGSAVALWSRFLAMRQTLKEVNPEMQRQMLAMCMLQHSYKHGCILFHFCEVADADGHVIGGKTCSLPLALSESQ